MRCFGFVFIYSLWPLQYTTSTYTSNLHTDNGKLARFCCPMKCKTSLFWLYFAIEIGPIQIWLLKKKFKKNASLTSVAAPIFPEYPRLALCIDLILKCSIIPLDGISSAKKRKKTVPLSFNHPFYHHPSIMIMLCRHRRVRTKCVSLWMTHEPIWYHVTGSLNFLPEQTWYCQRGQCLKRIGYMRASTGWKQHTHFVYHRLRGVCVWCFFQPDGGGIWGQTSGTLGRSMVCICVCICLCACLLLCRIITRGVTSSFQAPNAQRKTPLQWVCWAVIGPQLLLGQSYWAKWTGLDSSTFFFFF